MPFTAEQCVVLKHLEFPQPVEGNRDGSRRWYYEGYDPDICILGDPWYSMRFGGFTLLAYCPEVGEVLKWLKRSDKDLIMIESVREHYRMIIRFWDEDGTWKEMVTAEGIGSLEGIAFKFVLTVKEHEGWRYQPGLEVVKDWKHSVAEGKWVKK